MKQITVFTPTYNRAYILSQLYKSLLNQTNKNFIWLVIDDGSIDNTRELVAKWKIEAPFKIDYVFKENGGMHTAHNLAYSLIETELNVCIDSDDSLPSDAIKIILDIWNKIDNKNSFSGIVGLDADMDGKIIGTEMPIDIKNGSYYDLYKKVTGDKKFVLNTKLAKKYAKYPEYPNEKLVPLGILYIMMGKDNPFIFVNKVLCLVDYQSDGSSNGIFKQYANSPKGFAYARNIGKMYNNSFFYNVRNSIHIVSSAIFAKESSIISKGPKIYFNYLVIPFGFILNLYIRFKIKCYEKNI